MGGTAAGLKPETHGLPRTDDQRVFVFEAKDAKLVVPYTNITRIEYGETSKMTVGYIGSLYPKKEHHHFVTISYNDETNSPQTAVFEIGHSRVWTTLINLERKTGKKVEFSDENARRYARKQLPPGQTLGDQ